MEKLSGISIILDFRAILEEPEEILIKTGNAAINSGNNNKPEEQAGNKTGNS